MRAERSAVFVVVARVGGCSTSLRASHSAPAPWCSSTVTISQRRRIRAVQGGRGEAAPPAFERRAPWLSP